MRRATVCFLAVVFLVGLAAGGASAWVRARMFDANTPAGPNWRFLERPAWPVENDTRIEEFRSGELNGSSTDKRFSWRTIIPESATDARGKGKVRIDDIDNTKTTSILWSGYIETASTSERAPSAKTPALYIRIAAGSVKFSYNSDTTGGRLVGWYCSEGTRTNGGVLLFGTTYGMAVPHGVWHKVRLTAYTDGTWKLWVNDASPIADMWGNLDTGHAGNYVQWGAVDGTKEAARFYTEYCYWGQGEGEIDPVPDPGFGEQYDIGGVTVTPSGNSATITWVTEKTGANMPINKVYYGDKFHTLDQSADAVWNTDHWEAQLADLDWSKTYTFYCESTDSGGQEYDTGLYTFRTDSIVLPYLVNAGFESGVDIYPWVDVFAPPPGPPDPDDTQRWGRVYSDIDLIMDPAGAVLPASPNPNIGEPAAFSGFKTGGSPFREYGTIRQKAGVDVGKWYKAQVKFQGWGNIPYQPDDMVGRIGLDPNGDDAPGTLEGGVFMGDPDVWWGQAGAGIHGEYKTASVMCQATSPVMSVFLQDSFNLGNSGARLAFDDATFQEVPAPQPTTCGGAKQVTDLYDVAILSDVVVTARRVLYATPTQDVVGNVEDPDRAAGIRLRGTQYDWGGEFDVGSEVDVVGQVARNADGELEIQVRSMTEAADPTEAVVTPVGMTNKSLGGGPFGLQAGVEGGTGMNNIGLLVTVWGRVTAIGPIEGSGDFSVFIDDGSNLIGGETGSTTKRTGIEVSIPYETGISPTSFSVGTTYLAATGASSTKLWDPTAAPFPWDSVQKRVVRTRYDTDLVYVIP